MSNRTKRPNDTVTVYTRETGRGSWAGFDQKFWERWWTRLPPQFFIVGFEAVLRLSESELDSLVQFLAISGEPTSELTLHSKFGLGLEEFDRFLCSSLTPQLRQALRSSKLRDFDDEQGPIFSSVVLAVGPEECIALIDIREGSVVLSGNSADLITAVELDVLGPEFTGSARKGARVLLSARPHGADGNHDV